LAIGIHGLCPEGIFMAKNHFNTALGWKDTAHPEPEVNLGATWPKDLVHKEEDHWRRQNQEPLESAQERVQRLVPGFDLKRLAL
jgi:hypothetical protein